MVRFRVRGPGGAEKPIAAIIDSGFTSELSLPIATVAALGLSIHSESGARMADGQVHQFDVFWAEIEWDGRWRTVLVSGVGREALIGMRLLRGHDLRIAVVPGGAVEIQPIP